MLEVQQWLWKLRHGWLLLSAAQAYAFVVILPAVFKSNWTALKALFGNDEFIFGATSPWWVAGRCRCVLQPVKSADCTEAVHFGGPEGIELQPMRRPAGTIAAHVVGDISPCFASNPAGARASASFLLVATHAAAG